jgi:hypothetical protein
MPEFTHVFAKPGDYRSIIDYVLPGSEPPRSAVNGETLEQVRERYPSAAIVSWSEWMTAKIAEQSTPITWIEITREKYHEMLEILPPACWLAIGFLVGEPMDHDAATGRPRFDCFIAQFGKYYTASRPMTIAEFKTINAAGPQPRKTK